MLNNKQTFSTIKNEFRRVEKRVFKLKIELKKKREKENCEQIEILIFFILEI